MANLDTTTTDEIRRWYERGCDVTVYLPAASDRADANERFAALLGDLGVALSDIPGEAARNVVSALRDHGHAGGRGLVAVADSDDAHVWTSPLAVELDVDPGPLPSLGALIAAKQTWVPHAVVRIDREGADVDIVSEGRSGELTIEGATQHLTKSNPGGWSQQRFQQRAEEHWEDNASLVAERLQREVAAHDIDLVLVTGTNRMISLLRENLNPSTAAMLQDLTTGSRAADGSQDLVEEAVDSAVRAEALRRRAAAATRLADALGQDTGVTGRTDVLVALFEGRVDELLIVLGDTEGLTASVGAEGDQVVADSTVLHSLGLDATRVPLADAAIRGGLATGADITVVHGALVDLEDGVGALLRG